MPFTFAGRLGHESFADEILRLGPRSLLCQQNEKGDTPLHVAARSGQFKIVKLLIAFYQCPSTSDLESAGDLESGRSGTVSNSESLIRELQVREDVESERDMEAGIAGTASASASQIRELQDEGDAEVEPPPLWRMRNCENNTALHEALKNGHVGIALHLLEVDNGLALIVNDAGESPLYLAAEAGFLRVLRKILTQESPLDGRLNGQNPLHVAVSAGRTKSLEYLLEKIPELVKQADNVGKTALHYAAEANSLKMIRMLLKIDTLPAYMFDNDGLTPLLIAASSANSLRVQAILDSCPDSIELLDGNGRNALHLAVKNNYLSTARRLLRRSPEMRELINEPDDEGNTPLHLATKNHHYHMVKELMITKGVNLKTKNKEGLTALDICESDWELSFRQKFLWRYLKKHKASRGPHHYQGKLPPRLRTILYAHPKADLKQMANTLSVVSTLLATVTFAAAFTMPGGYSSKDENMGVAVLIKKAALKAFVLADTVAMCSSMMVAFLLIWAMLGDPTFLFVAVNWSMSLLFISLCGTMVAFVTGLYVVISPESLWLAIVVCFMGSSVPFLVQRLRFFSSLATPRVFRLQRSKTKR